MSATSDLGAAATVTPDRPAPIPWHLRVYVVVLALSIVHAVALMTAATIIRANPSLSPATNMPGWGHIIYYLATNLILIALSATVGALIINRRRGAITINLALCALSITFHVTWHLLGMKSTIGTVVDPFPILVGAVYLGTVPAARRFLIPVAGARRTSHQAKHG